MRKLHVRVAMFSLMATVGLGGMALRGHPAPTAGLRSTPRILEELFLLSSRIAASLGAEMIVVFPVLGDRSLEVREVSLSANLSGATYSCGATCEVRVSPDTRVALTLQPTWAHLRFQPGLTIDVDWPFSDVELAGFDFDPRAGRVLALDVRDRDPWLISSTLEFEQRARKQIAEIAETTFANACRTAGAAVTRRLTEDPAERRDRDTRLLPLCANPLVSVRFSNSDAISLHSDEAGLEVPAHQEFLLRMALEDFRQSLRGGRLRTFELRSDGLFVVNRGRREARLNAVRVEESGLVRVLGWEPISSRVKKACAAESLLRLLGVTLRAGAAGQRYAGAVGGRLTASIDLGLTTPRVVREITRQKLETALTSFVTKHLK